MSPAVHATFSRGLAYFIVTREPGRGWDLSRKLREQTLWDEHAAFMDALVEEGFIVLGGPVAGGPRAILVVNARNEREVEARLAADPWMPVDVSPIARIERWEVLLKAKPNP